MKKIFLFSATVLSLFAVTGCKSHLAPSTNITTETRSFQDFSRLDVSGGFEVYMIKSDTEEVKVVAPENYHPYIYISQSGETLVISSDEVIQGGSGDKKVFLKMNSLFGLTASGGCTFLSTDTFHVASFDAELNGGSSLDLRLVAAQFMGAASGGSNMTLAGAIQHAHLDNFSGGSTYIGYACPVDTVMLNGSGGCNFRVRANAWLDITASGGTTVYYRGYPYIQQNLSGGSSIINDN